MFSLIMKIKHLYAQTTMKPYIYTGERKNSGNKATIAK